MNKWIITCCIGVGFVAAGAGIAFSQTFSNGGRALPEFLNSPASAVPIQAAFVISEEWLVIDWDSLMESRGIEADKRENLKRLVAATAGYKTGAISSNKNAIVYYVRDTNALEWFCYKAVSPEQAEMARNGAFHLPLEEVDRAWRSMDEKLIGKDKEGQWLWVESSKPIPDFEAKMSGRALVSDSSRSMLIGDPDKYRVAADGGREKWEWMAQDMVAPRVSCRMIMDGKGRMREYAIMMGNSVAFRASVDGRDVPGREYGRYREEEMLPTADGKEWIHHRISYECIDTSMRVDDIIQFYRQNEATAIDAPEDSDI